MQGPIDKGAGALALHVGEQPTQLLPELAAQFVPVQPDLTRKEASNDLLRRWQLSYEPGSGQQYPAHTPHQA